VLRFSLPSSGSTGPVNTSSSAANNGENTGKLYVDRAHACERNSQTTIQVDFAHISSFQSELADAIREHHYRVMPFLAEAVQQFMKEHAPNHTGHKVHEANSFRPGFYNLPAESTIRDLKTGRIGQLMSIKGTVTRTSAVRPELASGTFRCLDCRTICANIVQQFKYTEVSRHTTNSAARTRIQCRVSQSG
jgi:DNA replication licensing factor MCM6